MKYKIILLMLLVWGAGLFAQTAREIIDEADRIFTGDRIFSTSSMTIYLNDEAQPVQTMDSYSLDEEGKDMSLSVYRSPARMKGTAYLMIEDDLWVRFASTGRVRKLSSSARKNSAGGSDFSYADMGEGNKGLAGKYNVTLSGSGTVDGIDCHVIDMIPKEGEDAPYERMEAFISKDRKHYLRINYYEAGAHIKSMFLKDYRLTDGKAYPFLIEMVSHTKNSRTVLETTGIEFNSSRVQKRFFSTAYLDTIE